LQQQALQALLRGSALIADQAPAGTPAGVVSLAQAELGWVLGLVERRRGALPEAERAWAAGVEVLDRATLPDPWTQYLRAATLAELGTLGEATGQYETARNLVARAASAAARVAQATGPAQALLDAWQRSADDPAYDEPLPAAAAVALTLAVVAAADRLARRMAEEAARLERVAFVPVVRPPLADVSHSRHLR
jgi:hypothetical protein